MIFNIKSLIAYSVVLIYLFKTNFYDCKEKKSVMNFERAMVSYFDPSYFKSMTVLAKRYNRSSRVHYLTIKMESLRPMDNNYNVNIYFYQLISKIYKRSFLEFNYKYCDFIITDNMLTPSLREAYYRNPVPQRPMKILGCPIIPGFYNCENMLVPEFSLPQKFSFSEGKIVLNITHKRRLIASGQTDFGFLKI